MKAKIFIISLMLYSCSWANTVQMDELKGIKVEAGKLNILVISQGCTTKESFKLNWSQDNLTIKRVQPDNCRRMPHKIWLKYDLPKGKTGFLLTNRINS